MVPCQEFLINAYSIKLSMSKNKNRNVFPNNKNYVLSYATKINVHWEAK